MRCKDFGSEVKKNYKKKLGTKPWVHPQKTSPQCVFPLTIGSQAFRKDGI